MKRVLLLLTLGVLLSIPTFAQLSSGSTPQPATPPPPSGPPPGGSPGMALTSEEIQELHQAQEAALAADPSLRAAIQDLQKRGLALQKKIRAAIIKADANTAPIIAKIEAAQAMHSLGLPPQGNPPPSGNPQPMPPPPSSGN